MRRHLAVGFSAALLAALLMVTPASCDEPVIIDVASTFPKELPLLGIGFKTMAERVEAASGGSLVLKLHEPNELVPAADTVNAVSDGRISAAWAGAGWFAGRDSAFNLFSAVPFGPDTGEYLAWLYRGGGLELARELFARYDVYNIPCAIIPPEASGWFRREIRSVDDLKGLRMRFFGMGAMVMAKLGVTTNQLAPGDILAALRDGTIDAAEFSLPSMDLPLRLYEAAPYYYFPAWHQQATLFDLYINAERWSALSLPHQTLLEMACGDLMRDILAEGEANQGEALIELQQRGVQMRRWPPEILVALDDAWQEVVAEESARSSNFAKVYSSYERFRAGYDGWRYLGRID